MNILNLSNTPITAFPNATKIIEYPLPGYSTAKDVEECFEKVLGSHFDYKLSNITHIVPPDSSKVTFFVGIEICNWLRHSSDIPITLDYSVHSDSITTFQRKTQCQSTNHQVPNGCWLEDGDQLWQCKTEAGGCGKWFCLNEGCDDDNLDLCDSCAFDKNLETQQQEDLEVLEQNLEVLKAQYASLFERWLAAPLGRQREAFEVAKNYTGKRLQETRIAKSLHFKRMRGVL